MKLFRPVVLLVALTGPALAGAPSQIMPVSPSLGGNTFTGTQTAPSFTSTVGTGTAPFTVSSTTVVPNLNSSFLLGNTWASPGVIGGTTPNAATFLATRVSNLNIVSPIITWSGSTLTPAMSLSVANIGSSTSGTPAAISLTSIDDMDSSGAANGSYGLNLTDAYGGNGTTKGGKGAAIITLTDNQGTTSDQGSNKNYVAFTVQNTRSFTQGGTALTNAGSVGRVFALNAMSLCQNTATFLAQCVTAELDINMANSSSTFYRANLALANLGASNFQAPGVDAMLTMYGGTYNVGPLLNGILYGTAINAWPFDLVNGSIEKIQPKTVGGLPQARWGFDFIGGTFPSTGNAYDGGLIRSSGFSVDGAGMMRQGTCYYTPSSAGVTVSCSGSVGTIANGAGAISSPGSGFPVNMHTAATDQYGGVYDMTVSGGVVTSVTVEPGKQPIFPAQTGLPTNIPLTAAQNNLGTGVSLTPTWNTTGNVFAFASGTVLQFGTFTATPCTNAGYVTINDSGGAARKVQICS